MGAGLQASNIVQSFPKAAATRFRRYLPVTGIVSLSVAITIVLLVSDAPIERTGGWGYPEIFVATVFFNVTLILPTLGHVFLVAAAQTLDPWLLGLVSGLGATVGELSGYAIGRSGGHAITGSRAYERYERITRGRGHLFGPTLFVFALTPLPFDVVGVMAGAGRYPVWRFAIWVGIAKVIHTTLIILAGLYTIGWLSRLFP